MMSLSVAAAELDAVVLPTVLPDGSPKQSLRPFDSRPFSYADPALIKRDLLAAGFTDIECETVGLSSRVDARDAAQGLVLGSPFRSEIERRDPSALDQAVNAVTGALGTWNGKDAPLSAHVVTATKAASPPV